MSKSLPTVYLGIPEPGPDTDATQAAIDQLTARFNAIPPHLFLRVISSFVASVCCSQTDPAGAFQLIGINVGRAIAAHLMKPEGSA